MTEIAENGTRSGAPGSEIKFTVIVCTYNYGYMLPDALRSLAAQTIADFELLIVDDGSTDNTEEVVRQYSSRFRNCVYLKKPHTGLADTRNEAVRKATGTHLAFLDADDLWSPRYLEAVRDRLESSPQTELVISNGLRILDSGMILGPIFLRNLPHVEGNVESVKNPYYLFNEFLPSGMVFLKSLYERIGGFDPRFDQGLGDDIDWVIRAVAAGAQCARVYEKVFLYRYHGHNLTSSPVRMLDPWLIICDEHVMSGQLGQEFKRTARNLTHTLFVRIMAVCTPSKSRALLAQAMRTFPDDAILRCFYLSTYAGSTYALKALRWGRHMMPKRNWRACQIDLSLPPERMFQSV